MIENQQFKEKIFSGLDRSTQLDQASQTIYDLIVIGGGITGAGIALDASLRGLKTLLLEKQDFASGTSSKSTKLIHGGLRYLKQLEIGLVRETGTERAVAHRNIPHLVHPEDMLLPIVSGGTFNKWTASMAISVYDFLANVPSKDKKRMYNRQKTLKLEPQLKDDLIKSGIIYSEYRTDDARLTIELIKAARREGAEAFNYAKVESFLYENGSVSGVHVRDVRFGDSYEFKATQVVSAAGPWVDELRTKDKSKDGKSLHLTKGVHIVVDKEKLPLNQSVYFDDFKGRMIFAIPRGKVTYIGTSDTTYKKDKDRVLCTLEDVDYLLAATNHIFDSQILTREDVISSWAGLRPLIHENGKSPSELSRKDEIFESETGLISIAGGKLTGFRKMAERIVDLVLDKHDQLAQQDCKTKEYDIHVDSFGDYEDFERYHNNMYEKNKESISAYDAWYLTSTYGKNAEAILEMAKTIEIDDIEKAIIKAEIVFGIEYEALVLPDDYFNRRSGRLYFDVHSITKHFDFIMDEFQSYHNWDTKEFESIKDQSLELIKDCTVFQ